MQYNNLLRIQGNFFTMQSQFLVKVINLQIYCNSFVVYLLNQLVILLKFIQVKMIALYYFDTNYISILFSTSRKSLRKIIYYKSNRKKCYKEVFHFISLGKICFSRFYFIFLFFLPFYLLLHGMIAFSLLVGTMEKAFYKPVQL